MQKSEFPPIAAQLLGDYLEPEAKYLLRCSFRDARSASAVWSTPAKTSIPQSEFVEWLAINGRTTIFRYTWPFDGVLAAGDMAVLAAQRNHIGILEILCINSVAGGAQLYRNAPGASTKDYLLKVAAAAARRGHTRILVMLLAWRQRAGFKNDLFEAICSNAVAGHDFCLVFNAVTTPLRYTAVVSDFVCVAEHYAIKMGKVDLLRSVDTFRFENNYMLRPFIPCRIVSAATFGQSDVMDYLLDRMDHQHASIQPLVAAALAALKGRYRPVLDCLRHFVQAKAFAEVRPRIRATIETALYVVDLAIGVVAGQDAAEPEQLMINLFRAAVAAHRADVFVAVEQADPQYSSDWRARNGFSTHRQLQLRSRPTRNSH